jgi:hypothetical protein
MPVQENRSWTPYWNEDSTLMGFKDSEGRIKNRPQKCALFLGPNIRKDSRRMEAEKRGFEILSDEIRKSRRTGQVYMIDTTDFKEKALSDSGRQTGKAVSMTAREMWRSPRNMRSYQCPEWTGRAP